MIEIDRNQLTATITNDFIVQYVPDEQDLLPAILETFQHHPQKFLREQEGKEKILGSGLAEVSTLVAPVVIFIVSAALTTIVEKSTDSLIDKIKGIFTRSQKKKIVHIQDLSQEQLVRLHEEIHTQAITHHFSEMRAKQLADSVIAALVTAQTTKKP